VSAFAQGYRGGSAFDIYGERLQGTVPLDGNVGAEKIGDLHVNLRVKSAISPEARYLGPLPSATLSKRDLACGEL
jgi:hypothetical protein